MARRTRPSYLRDYDRQTLRGVATIVTAFAALTAAMMLLPVLVTLFVALIFVVIYLGYLAISEEIRSNREAVAAAATPSTTVASGSVR
jgi:predicted membrane protein